MYQTVLLATLFTSSNGAGRNLPQRWCQRVLEESEMLSAGITAGFFSFRSGHPHGHGTLLYFTDDSKGRYNYTGNFVRGQRSGQGTTAFRDNRVYTGSYEKNKENGRGKIR